MDFTVDQTLQKGIEAHRAGKVQEADRYYTAILKANPKHPDANHNMGILAVDLGKIELGLPFLKTDLKVNSSIDQYWLSYIGALIKLDRIADAKEVFEQAKSKGAKGDGFDQIEFELESASGDSKNKENENILTQANILDELKLDKALKLANNKVKDGLSEEAKKIYQDILKKFPKNKKAQDGIKILGGKILATSPNIKEPSKEKLNSLLKLYNQQKLQQVYNEAKTLTKRYTNSLTLWSLIGASAAQLGKLDEAVFAFQKALVIKPDDAQTLYNMGNALKDQERLEEAIESYKKALSLKPDYAEVYVNMGNILKDQERLEEAIASYNKALSLKADYADAYVNMGNILIDQEKLEEAIESYNKALATKPDHAEAHYNMGNALREQERLEEAIESYKKALSLKPDFADVYVNMGNALLDQEKLEEAIEAYKNALSIQPDYAEAYVNMGNALTGVIFEKPSVDLQKTIVALLDRETYIRPRYIAKAAISLLKLEPTLQKLLKVVDTGLLESPVEVISNLNEFPLLLKLMSVCPLPDPEIEGLLTNLRCAILLNISSLKEVSPEFLEFQSALALQCFNNEYIYNHFDEEEKILTLLDTSVRKTLENNNQPSPQIILALASYKPLNKYDWSKLLVVADHIKEVFSRQFEEPNQEEKLKYDLPRLDKITDSISTEVRAQYEENPYPRWINLGLHLKPLSVSKVADEIKLKLSRNSITEVEKPEILIAGCGTGQQSIDTASRFKDSKVLAIDLSLSSLGYAKRKTEELGIDNIKYMQADILDLGQLNKQFDIIESAGVLHHMENPMAGWKVLVDCLKPSGLLKIGLYSELARQHIVKIRKEIRQKYIRAIDAEMRYFRALIMKSDKNHHKQIRRFTDFYSLSELKDLLFHVKEHRFTIPEIKEHLDKLDLQFCGFESQTILSHFKETNKNKDDLYDLDKWQAYEQANPKAFAGMYQFWCQKVD